MEYDPTLAPAMLFNIDAWTSLNLVSAALISELGVVSFQPLPITT
jgi:hypothetical protein